MGNVLETENLAQTKPEPTYCHWTIDKVLDLYNTPFADLIFQAQQVHRQYFDANEIQLSTLLSIKTGGCPEDCSYCPQSIHHAANVQASKLMSAAEVRQAAMQAKQAGASRFCMGAAWREPKDRDIEKVAQLIQIVKEAGLEACCTLGMLTLEQAKTLKAAGLDYYNHNLDTAPQDYVRIISTRTYQERLDTLSHVRLAGLKTCCGGIVGMGESREDRAGLIAELANLNPYPESVPINHLVAVPGTRLAQERALDPFEFVRTIAVARLTMPKAWVRLSAGRQALGDGIQALCFLAGANSIFYGDKLLVTGNPDWQEDQKLMQRLDLTACESTHVRCE